MLQAKRKIIDITGIELTPGNGGSDCLGNGEHEETNFECCCDECGYYLCCFNAPLKNLGLTARNYPTACADCNDPRCPRKDRLNE